METRGTSFVFGSTRMHLCMASPLLLSLITGSFPSLFLESSMYTAWTDTLIVHTSGQHTTHHLYTSTCWLYMVFPCKLASLLQPQTHVSSMPANTVFFTRSLHTICTLYMAKIPPHTSPIIHLTFLPGNVLSSLTLFVQIRKLIRRKHTLPSCKRRCVLS